MALAAGCEMAKMPKWHTVLVDSNTLSICTVVSSLGILWAAEFVLWASSYQSCMGECMGLHTFCMEPPIHAWCAQYSYEHTVHDLI